MNILFISHSALLGGAERGGLGLVRLLTGLGHRVSVMLPAGQGALIAPLAACGARLVVMPAPSVLQRTSQQLVALALTDFAALDNFVISEQIELVISNTLDAWHGACVAARRGLPHIWYVHEKFDKSPEIFPHGLEPDYVYAVVGELSDQVLCCSQHVVDTFRAAGVPASALAVLPPHTRSPRPSARRAEGGTTAGRVQINVVGTKLLRKNAAFAIDVLAALLKRGRDVSLQLIGGTGSVQQGLASRVQRRGLGERVRLLGLVDDPYSHFDERSLTLVCSQQETFGLTVIESLERGIPVLASDCGGPRELLTEESLFAVDDLDSCVRRIEAALVDWPGLLERTRSQFERISPRFDPARQAEVVATVIAGLPATPAEARKKTVPVWLDGPRMARALRLPELSLPDICEHVAAESGLSVAEVGRRVEDETRQSGLAVGGDCQKFDVVPFGHGARMEALYREGVGFAIELMATHTDVARWTMASFAATTLSSHAWRLGRPALRVLALGDGIGMDSARLASLGFDIHYIDFDGSLTSRVARRNLQLFGERRPDAGQVRILDGAPPPAAWDAIVCFEVIEHVPDPAGFLDYLASLLVDGGLLLMSECFDGIQDRWPTHLRGNEAQAGLLPAMAVASGLALHDYNPDPFGKPYVFRKTDAGTAARRLVQQLADPVLVRRTLLAQARVRDDLR